MLDKELGKPMWYHVDSSWCSRIKLQEYSVGNVNEMEGDVKVRSVI